MDGMLTYLLIALVTLVLGFLAGRYIQLLRTKSGQSALAEREKQLHKHIQTLEERLDKSTADNQELGRQKEELGFQLVRYQADMDNLRQKNQEQKEEVEKLQEKFTKEFENLANKILEEKSSKFAKQNKESLENILNPLKEKIKTFEDKVEKTHKESIDYHAALRQQIFGLKELNEQMSREATNLTKALKGDSKMQGNWGELVLERVLEKSGLEKDREYSVQKSFTLEDGSRVLPDVIINLPDGKKMIVDSKVSLTDYERYVNAED
ncbi:MAG: DNA recombination protein RmuC, partial [Flavobacteriaceae bacterium]|nr:DNA recombination protein RmuC [Eudoraea sp.]NNJ38126.1 DNA recombination protein RmuC [Flavobacteriaceae bacterium]